MSENRKRSFYLLCLLSTFFIGCSTKKMNLEGVNFETVKYYDSFLFVPAKSTSTSKKMEINFNNWAKHNNSHVTLLMYYQNKANTNPCYFGTDSSPLISIYLNDKLCKDGEIKLNKETEKSLNLRIEFSTEAKEMLFPEAKDTLYTGYFVVMNSKIDRINNIKNISNKSKVFRWSVRYKIIMNPLKSALLWGIGAIILSLFIWFVFFRNLIYRKMRKGKIMINTPYTKSIKIAGGRKLVLTTKSRKQKNLHKIFAGKILYETNPVWDSEIVFYPIDRRSLRIKTGVDYTITPYTNRIIRGKSYEIQKGKKIIKISFL